MEDGNRYSKEKMRTRPSSFILLLALILVTCSSGCAQKAPTSVNYYQAGLIRLTPGQSGKNLPIVYSLPVSGDSVRCNTTMEQLQPGDAGKVNWTLKNLSIMDSGLTVKANVTSVSSTSSVGGPTIEYIGIKLRNDNVYLLGDDSHYVPLVKLVPVLVAQIRSIAGETNTTYELEWQIAVNTSQAGHDGIFGTADDIPVDSDTVGYDKTVLDVTFTLINSDWNE
jgi:hypothetical protein